MYRVLVFQDPDPRVVKRLLQRNGGRVVAVAVLLEINKPQELAALSRHYRAKPLALPPELLLKEGGSG